MQEAIAQAVNSAQKLYGADIRMNVARCPAWGGDDCCILVYGKFHALAARAFGLVVKGTRIEEQAGGGFRGSETYTYSVVTFPALAA